MASVFEDLSREELLEASRELARLASERDGSRLDSRADFGQSKDPLVRKLAGFALRELRKPRDNGGYAFSYRELASMFGVSPARVHALFKELVGEDADELQSVEREAKSG
jgi:hypothetical protein